MNLSSMRFKTFVWPHNPRIYTITFERKMAVNKIPFGRHCLQSLGQTRRIFRGEGEFVGEGAYDTFRELGTLFYEETPGVLVHPLWMSTNVWFVGLNLEQEPRSDYVRYSFEFWETVAMAQTTLTALGDGNKTQSATEKSSSSEPLWHIVVRGDSLWAIANRYATTVAELLKLNPDIANPNLILQGQKVRVR